MLYLSKLIFTIDGNISFVKRGNWCQDMRHQIGVVTKAIPTNCWCCTHIMQAPALLVGWYGGSCTVGLVNFEGRAYLRWRSGVLSKTSYHMWDSWYFQMFLLGDGSLTLMNMASLMVLGSYVIPYPIWGNCPIWYDDQWSWHGHIWGKVPWDVPLNSQIGITLPSLPVSSFIHIHLLSGCHLF